MIAMLFLHAAREADALSNKALHRLAALLRMLLNLKGHILAARGVLER